MDNYYRRSAVLLVMERDVPLHPNPVVQHIFQEDTTDTKSDTAEGDCPNQSALQYIDNKPTGGDKTTSKLQPLSIQISLAGLTKQDI